MSWTAAAALLGYLFAAATAPQLVHARSGLADPIVVSGKVKPLNRDPEIAGDRQSGNALVVWNQSKRNAAFGHVWAAELIRQSDGSYVAGKEFRVSTKATSQRPTVEFVPGLGVYMIMWDEGPRDPEGLGEKGTRVLSRVYTPTGTLARSPVGEFEPVVAMTDGREAASASALSYIGPASIFERLVYRWWGTPTGSRTARMGRGGSRKGNTDINKKKKTLKSAPEEREVDAGKAQPYTIITDIRTCPDGRVYMVAACVDLAARPVMSAEFGLVCLAPGSLQGTFTPLGGPVPLPVAGSAGLSTVHATMRRDDACKSLQIFTNGGAFEVDAATQTASSQPIDLNPASVIGSYFGAPAGNGRRAAPPEGYVFHTPSDGAFAYRALKSNGGLTGTNTELWRIRRERLLGMDVEELGDTVLVAWAEAANRRGSRAVVKIGWFVPE